MKQNSSSTKREYASGGLRLTLLIITGVLGLAAAGYFVAYPLLTTKPIENTATSGTAQPGQVSQKTVAVTKNAQAIADTKGSQAATEYLKAEVEKTDNKKDKALLLGTLGIYSATDQSPAAIKTGLAYQIQSYELDPSDSAAAIVAQAYAKLGDKPNAIKYYNLVIDYIKKNGTKYGVEEGKTGYEFYENEIKALQ